MTLTSGHDRLECQPKKNRTVSYVLHAMKGDATNSVPGSQGTKAHTCKIWSKFRCPDVQATNEDVNGVVELEPGAGSEVQEAAGVPQPPDSVSRATWTHLARVPSSCTALKQRCIMLKQVESIGVRSWLECGHLSYWLPTDDHVHVEIWIFSSDAGPDQTVR